MAIRTYKVTLDSKNSIAPEPVFLRQGDKTGAVVIDATLMDNGSPVSLSGLVPMFKANTADGQAVIADSTGFMVTDSANGKFTYQVPNALSAIPGKITTAYFSFSDASGSESTFDVAFIIKKSVDITKPQADDYITIIDGTLQSLQQKIDAINTDVQTILNVFNQGDVYNKTQTDSKDADTLASAKSYADTQDTYTLANAKAYADTQDNMIKGLSQGGPKGVYDTLDDLKRAHPTNDGNIYVIKADNSWYYHNGTTWVAGGVYMNNAIGDQAVSVKNLTYSARKGKLNFDSGSIVINTDTKFVTIPAGAFKDATESINFEQQNVPYILDDVQRNYVFGLYFDCVVSAFYLLTNNEFNKVTSDMSYLGYIDVWNRHADLSAPYIFNQLTTIKPYAKDANIFVANSNINPIDFRFSDKKIVIPELDLRIQGNSVHTKAQTLDYSSQPSAVLFYTITFDTKERAYHLYSFSELRNISDSETTLAFFNIDNLMVNILAYYTIDGGEVYKRDYLDAVGFVVGLNKPLYIDFTSRKVIIPATVNVVYKDYYIYASVITGGRELTIDMASSSEQRLLFNTKTNKFRCEPANNAIVEDKIWTNDILIGVISADYKKFVGTCNFTTSADTSDDTKDALPNYVYTGLQDLYNNVISKKKSNIVSFGYITDTHGYLDHIKAISEYSKMGLMDFVVHNGDFAVVEKPYDVISKELAGNQKELSAISLPVYTTRGNHDGDSTGEHPENAGYDTSTITSENFAQRLIYSNKQDIVNKQRDGYYYHDDPEHKLRYIFTNGSNGEQPDGTGNTYKRWAWDKPQLEWFANTALNLSNVETPEEWHVAVFGHENIEQAFSNTVVGGNGSTMLGIMNAFVNGTKFSDNNVDVTFTTKGTLIGYFFGHTHCDALKKTEGNSFYQISTASSLPDHVKNPPANNTSWERPANDLKEDCWDNILINKATKHVDLLRYGAGENRKFDY